MKIENETSGKHENGNDFIADVSGSSFRKDNYTLAEVKEIAIKFTLAATPSYHLQGVYERFEEIWKLNFGE